MFSFQIINNWQTIVHRFIVVGGWIVHLRLAACVSFLYTGRFLFRSQIQKIFRLTIIHCHRKVLQNKRSKLCFQSAFSTTTPSKAQKRTETMSFKDNEEPKAFLIWNRHPLTPTTIVGRESPTPLVDGLTRFNFVYGTEPSEYSPLQAGDITPINEATGLDELEEIERSMATSRSPVYVSNDF